MLDYQTFRQSIVFFQRAKTVVVKKHEEEIFSDILLSSNISMIVKLYFRHVWCMYHFTSALL